MIRRKEMSKQTDYTPEEWKTIAAAPMMAGLVVSASDLSGPIGTMKEALAVAKGVTETAESTSSELIKALAEGMKTWSGRPEIPELPRDRGAVRTALIDGCKRAAATVTQKSPAEAEEYKRWLVSLARKTAEAAKEGGFLGIGGARVSEAENTAINELASALGVKVS
jgi:hypothetical protein